jgi:hypothetical protein
VLASDFADWSDEDLIAFEQSLYEDEVDGVDNWDLRDHVLWEINYRGLFMPEIRRGGLLKSS